MVSPYNHTRVPCNAGAYSPISPARIPINISTTTIAIMIRKITRYAMQKFFLFTFELLERAQYSKKINPTRGIDKIMSVIIQSPTESGLF